MVYNFKMTLENILFENHDENIECKYNLFLISKRKPNLDRDFVSI